jgi:cytoskeletal protein CcmA (bactofilin family)
MRSGRAVRRFLLLQALVLLGCGPSLAANTFADSVVITEAIDDDLYAAGGEVRIEGSVAGDATLAAGSVEISGDIEGDAILAGGRVNLAGGVGDDLRAAGGNVQITGFVTDHATIAGGSVTVGPGSAIAGRTWIAGGDVEMAGQIGDDLYVAAGTAVISGRVVGNAEITAREIRVEPGAVIGGDLIWRSELAPLIAEGAEILGEVRPAGEDEPEAAADESASRFGGEWAVGIALAAAGLILLWFAPQLAARATVAFREAPGRTLLLGAASIVLTPIAALVLFATVLGWLLGLVVLAGYVFALLLAGLVGLLIVTNILRGRLGGATANGGWRSAMVLLVIVVVLVLAQRVPGLGGLLSVLLVLAGFGALTALVTGRSTGRPAGTGAVGGGTLPGG